MSGVSNRKTPADRDTGSGSRSPIPSGCQVNAAFKLEEEQNTTETKIGLHSLFSELSVLRSQSLKLETLK